MESFAEAVKEVGVVDKKATMEGRSLTMILSPKPAEKASKKKSAYNQ